MTYKQSNEHRVERDFSELVKEFELAETKLEMVIYLSREAMCKKLGYS